MRWNRGFQPISICSLISLSLIALTYLLFLRYERERNSAYEKISQLVGKLERFKQNDLDELHAFIADYMNKSGTSANEESRRTKQLSSGFSNELQNFTRALSLLLEKCGKPSDEYENLRRRLRANIMEEWYFIRSQVTQLRLVSDTSEISKLMRFLNTANEYKRSLVQDLTHLPKIDGFDDWRKKEHEKLGDLVQQRLNRLQNPENCETARKLVCNVNKGCGFACQMHHVIYCLIVAYATQRTLILKSANWRYSQSGWDAVFKPISDSCVDTQGASESAWPPANENVRVVRLPIVDSLSPVPAYLPQSVPQDLVAGISRFHGDPIVWWVGQFIKYLWHFQPHIQTVLDEFIQESEFKSPIVGIHIRRTDKIGTEANFHSLDEYMVHVEEFYETLSLSDSIDKRRVYIATDEPKIFPEFKRRYPHYEILGNVSISKSAQLNARYSTNSLVGIIQDIHLLSLTDFVVCTFSSQVCRLAYELMNSRHYDASHKYQSLDDNYYFGGQSVGRFHQVLIEHRASQPEEINLKTGDVISVAGNHWNGFSKGTNTRTSQTGLYPTFKVVPTMKTAEFPTYTNVYSTD